MRHVTGGEAAYLREEITVVLAGKRWHRRRVATVTARAVTAGAATGVCPLTARERLPGAVLGLAVGRCLRKPAGEIAQRLRAVHIRRLEALVHNRAVQLGARTTALDELRELRDQISRALPGERRDLPRTITPCLAAVTARAVLHEKHHTVRHVRSQRGGLRCQVRGHRRRGQQRHQQQRRCSRPPHRYDGMWHDRSTCDGRRVMSSFPDHLHALLYPRAYPHPVRAVELIETHISWVLLTGRFAYKIKRPVHYPFVDLRSAVQRRLLCRVEVRLNRRFAPELYLGVQAIRERKGEARIGGSGRIIEDVVKMRRFPRAQELAALLEARRIEPAQLESFGGELARTHERLPVAHAGQRWGEPAVQIAVIKDNAAECIRAAQVLGHTAALRALQATLGEWADAAWPLLARRFADGRVRECHGDLHAGNIVRRRARLTPFDCLEFDPALRWIDVADEVSFLLADLAARRRPLHAHAFLSGYLAASGDYQLCLLAPVFKAHRALVRAKILALTAAARGMDGAAARLARRSYRSYVECAQQALAPQRPTLVLMSGLSGSGKTWLAQRLAPALGAVHLRSDIERKRLVGLPPAVRSHSALARGLYAREMTIAVYQHLADCAADTLAGGYTTIVDATFARAEDRMRFRAVALRLGVSFCIVYCHAPRHLLEKRISERRRRVDPSEADLRVLHWQEAHFTVPAPQEAGLVLDAARFTPERLARCIARKLSSGVRA